jgi:hypothetical protein
MDKALELMPSGIVSVWTHKAILPEIVSTMHGLGRLRSDVNGEKAGTSAPSY